MSALSVFSHWARGPLVPIYHRSAERPSDPPTLDPLSAAQLIDPVFVDLPHALDKRPGFMHRDRMTDDAPATPAPSRDEPESLAARFLGDVPAAPIRELAEIIRGAARNAAVKARGEGEAEANEAAKLRLEEANRLAASDRETFQKRAAEQEDRIGELTRTLMAAPGLPSDEELRKPGTRERYRREVGEWEALRKTLIV